MKSLLFNKKLGRAAAILLTVWILPQAGAAVTEVPPFTGTNTETWEEFPNYQSGGQYSSLPILGGLATISDSASVIFIYEPSAGAGWGLCDFGAEVNDGTKGMGLDTAPDTATIVFNTPVTDFGAYWGAIVGCGSSTISFVFLDADGNQVGTDSFDYVSPDSNGALEWRGYHFSVPVKSLTYTGNDVVTDGVQVNIASCAPVPPNMIAWWRADGNADDSVGGNNGALLGGVTFTSGEVAQAFNFDGTSAHVEIPSSSSLNPSSQITVDAWVKTTSGASQELINKYDYSGEQSYALRIGDATHVQWLLNGPAPFGNMQANVPIADGNWHHLAATYDGATMAIYFDGVLANSQGNSGDIIASNAPVVFGAGYTGGFYTGLFTGQLDEVEIFNRALTADEITRIAEAGPLGKCECTPPPANMISWWPAEGDTTDVQDGNILTDGAGNGFGYGVGEVGQAFTFDGTQFLTAGTPANLNITGDKVTIDGWIEPNTSDPSGHYFGKALASGHDYAVLFTNGTLYGVIRTASGEHYVAPGVETPGSIFVPPAGARTHVALTYDGANMKLYANGTEIGSLAVTGDIAGVGAPFNLGGRADGFDFNGKVDEVEVFDRALSDSEIAAIYHAGSAGKCRPCTPPPTGMVGWWPGDGNLADIQGGHNGTGSGGGPTFGAGKVGPAMDFDGVDDFFTAANVPDPNKAFTFDAWVYWRGSTGSGQQTLVEKLDGIGGASYLLAIADNGLVVSVVGGNLPGGLTFNVNDPIPANQWTHIAETDDGSTVNIYINGQLATSVTADRNTSTDLLYFGSIGSQFFLNGQMDEIEIYSRDLSQPEIQAIYDAGGGGKCKPSIPGQRQLANISSRANVGTGDDVAIGGFIIRADPAPITRGTRANVVTKQVLIRGIGPSLQVNNTPLAGRLMDPYLELHDGNGALMTFNDDWADTQGPAIQATGLAPSDPKEAAILANLNVGSGYTAILSGVGNTTGIGLVEVYDLEFTGNSHLVNISTRGFVATGDDVLIGGLIVQGGTAAPVLLRAIGPSLTGLNVPDALDDPVLELHDGNGALLESNDDWGSSPESAAIFATGLEPTDPKESAILFTPAPGGYTAIVSGKNPNPTGVALVEAYRLSSP